MNRLLSDEKSSHIELGGGFVEFNLCVGMRRRLEGLLWFLRGFN